MSRELPSSSTASTTKDQIAIIDGIKTKLELGQLKAVEAKLTIDLALPQQNIEGDLDVLNPIYIEMLERLSNTFKLMLINVARDEIAKIKRIEGKVKKGVKDSWGTSQEKKDKLLTALNDLLKIK